MDKPGCKGVMSVARGNWRAHLTGVHPRGLPRKVATCTLPGKRARAPGHRAEVRPAGSGQCTKKMRGAGSLFLISRHISFPYYSTAACCSGTFQVLSRYTFSSSHIIGYDIDIAQAICKIHRGVLT